MSDKILTEAFDKLKAIEESEDPFCIGAKGDDEAQTYTEVTDEVTEVTEDERRDLSMDEIDEGIEEFQEIQREMYELKDRLTDAIRAYAPRSLSYWQSYGLAQLAIVIGSDEYASHDKSINNLISDLEDERNAEPEGDEGF